MANRDEIKEQILNHADIVEIIGEVVELRRRGKNFVGLCPFHNEKTPSFNVSPEKGIYKCFGCGKTGNVFSFMMDYHALTFPQAMETLAARLGIVIQRGREDKSIRESLTNRDLVLKSLGAAAGHFAFYLRTQGGLPGYQYFLKRKFSNELITKFTLGYAPDSWDETMKELIRQGFTEEILHEAGLVIKKDAGGYYDRFRGRAIFPIKDIHGKIVGFGARRMKEEDNQPKYINSPQTAVYDKSRVLYGLFESKRDIIDQKYTILVEGYADVLTLHQAGISNVVASSGTALTREQLELLLKVCKKLYFVYDADTAGIKASERGLELALEQGFDVMIACLPAGEDPDSLVRDHGKDVFMAYIRDAINFIGFKISQYKNSGSLASPSGIAESARELLKIITKIPDRLQHDFYIREMASMMGLSESQLQRIYREKTELERKQADKPAPSAGRVPPGEKENSNDNTGTKGSRQFALNEAGILGSLLNGEKLLLQIALSEKGIFGEMLTRHNLNYENFVTDEGRHLFQLLCNVWKKDSSLINLIMDDDDIEPVIKEVLSSIAFSEEPSENWSRFGTKITEPDIDRSIEDAITSLEIAKIDKRLQELKASLPNASVDQQLEIAAQISALNSKRHELADLFNYVVKMQNQAKK